METRAAGGIYKRLLRGGGGSNQQALCVLLGRSSSRGEGRGDYMDALDGDQGRG